MNSFVSSRIKTVNDKRYHVNRTMVWYCVFVKMAAQVSFMELFGLVEKTNYLPKMCGIEMIIRRTT